MTLSVKTLANINLILQVALIAIVFTAAYLAQKKKKTGIHCTLIRLAVLLQIISVVAVMYPALLGYLERGQRGPLFNAEAVVHHTLGALVVIIFILVNLILWGIIPGRSRVVIFMRSALVLWIVTLLIGLHLFVLVWGWPLPL